MKKLKQFRFPLQRTIRVEPSLHASQITPEDIALIQELIRTDSETAQGAIKGRQPTDEEVIAAAWANVAIEEPTVTREDAERALANQPRQTSVRPG